MGAIKIYWVRVQCLSHRVVAALFQVDETRFHYCLFGCFCVFSVISKYGCLLLLNVCQGRMLNHVPVSDIGLFC